VTSNALYSLAENARYARALARRGYSVIPCCWPDANGGCACPRNHRDLKEVGKAPLTPRGVLDATTNPAVIQQRWRRTPNANVSIGLWPDYIMLDPDSDEARAECYRYGVPDTLTRYSRNKAFIFRAPEGLGHVRLIHKGESRAIDILNGYCVVFGTHRTGARVFLENPTLEPAPAPHWVLEWIEKHRREGPAPVEFPLDDPPVRLSETGLEWWRGLRAVKGPNGEIDRSATLFHIGLLLVRANASPGAIAEALAERDQALCYDKYTGRKDAATRYGEIAARAVQQRASLPFKRGPVVVRFQEARDGF